jgi:hypothetical protein
MDIALPVAFTKVLDQALELIYGLETYVSPTVVLGTTFSLFVTVHREDSFTPIGGLTVLVAV